MVVRSRTGEGHDSPLTLRVIRRLPSKNSPPTKKKKEKKDVVGVLRKALEMQRRLREPGVGNRAGLARTLGVSRAHISQSLAVLDVPGRLMDTLVRAEEAGKPVTVGAWRKVKGLPEEAAIGKLREMGYP
jgi:hypothetical protein